jgi:RNA polymerase sigma factor (TIGR02999 family)
MASLWNDVYLVPATSTGHRLVSTRLSAEDSGSTIETGPGQASLDRLLPAVYDELRDIARRQLSAREPGNTLSPTGLVHEAYLKLVDQRRVSWRDRAHFVALASVVMRHVLVDRARARLAEKREGHRQRVTLDSELVPAEDQPEAMLQLSDAIERLALVEPRLARVVDCRFFGGLTDDQIAEALEITRRTVQRDWVKARMLLRRALSP